jgi:hypothetical protein
MTAPPAPRLGRVLCVAGVLAFAIGSPYRILDYDTTSDRVLVEHGSPLQERGGLGDRIAAIGVYDVARFRDMRPILQGPAGVLVVVLERDGLRGPDRTCERRRAAGTRSSLV